MLRGPNGEKRPADAVGCAVMVAKIATGEIEEEIAANRDDKVNGGKARADGMTPGGAKGAGTDGGTGTLEQVNSLDGIQCFG